MVAMKYNNIISAWIKSKKVAGNQAFHMTTPIYVSFSESFYHSNCSICKF